MTTDDLACYLASLERENDYVVLQTLKSTEAEETQLVRMGDETSPICVRKIMTRESGFGQAYKRILSAQSEGQIFSHLPQVFEYYATEDRVIVIVEYTTGQTLSQVIASDGPGERTVGRYFPNLCQAVSELHTGFSPPIIHRDLKPENILVANENGTELIKLIDFGIARTFNDGADTDTSFFGTRAYAPPEQFGFRQTDERSDIYALGMLLYFCLTGRTPQANLHDSSFSEEDISPAWRSVLMKATELDPSMRYPSAADLQQAIESILHPLGSEKDLAETSGEDALALSNITRSIPFRIFSIVLDIAIIASNAFLAETIYVFGPIAEVPFGEAVGGAAVLQETLILMIPWLCLTVPFFDSNPLRKIRRPDETKLRLRAIWKVARFTLPILLISFLVGVLVS